MPNLAKIYHQSCGRVPPSPEQEESSQFVGEQTQQIEKPQQVDAVRQQLKISWLQSTVTEEMVKSLSNDRDSLLKQAINLAETYQTNGNHQQIINCLIKASTIGKVIEQYVGHES